jgi:hypothetical protein
MTSQPQKKTRREFIIQSTLTTAMLPFLYSCGQSSSSSSSIFDKSAINKLRKSFGGQIFLPSDAEYDLKRQAGYRNPDMDKHPAIIATCKNEQDVSIALEFAQEHQLEIAVRSGNHSSMGWGTVENGIVIDLSQIKEIVVNANKQTCHVSAGATAAEILASTAPYGLAPVLGECPTVGSGLVLGGGLGWLSGKYGATCDNLLKARVVTSDLRTLDAGSGTNSDLFWAIRGGGGNFGIATSFEYQLHPLKEMLGGSFSYPINKARDILQFFNKFMATAPDDLQADCYLTEKECWVEFVYFGDLDTGDLLLNQFRKFQKPERDSVKRRQFSEVYNMEPGGEFTPYNYMINKASYIEQMSDEVIDFVLECLGQAPHSCKMFCDFSHYVHGEISRVLPDATAFELRKPNAVHLVFLITWKEQSESAAMMKWINEKFERLQTYGGGRIFANYMSVPGGASAKAVFGSNFLRLKQIKKKYDPNNVFHLNQNILPG